MNKTTIAPRIQVRACAVLVLVALTLTASLAGCVTEQPNNGSASTINPVNVTHTYYYTYNGTSYLTGIIKNVGTQNLVDISLQAEGYANNTTYRARLRKSGNRSKFNRSPRGDRTVYDQNVASVVWRC